MKFTVQMKDPDGVSNSIDDAAREFVAGLELNGKLSADELDALVESRRVAIGNVTKKWFKWGEYITVEIDTDAGTCTVMGARE